MLAAIPHTIPIAKINEAGPMSKSGRQIVAKFQKPFVIFAFRTTK